MRYFFLPLCFVLFSPFNYYYSWHSQDSYFGYLRLSIIPLHYFTKLEFMPTFVLRSTLHTTANNPLRNSATYTFLYRKQCMLFTRHAGSEELRLSVVESNCQQRVV